MQQSPELTPSGAPVRASQHARVVVVGAGIVGACCALALVRAGFQVTVVDAGEPGGEQAASFGNGGWISPASVIPMATPGLARRVPSLLADRDGPLTIRPSALPRLAPWLWRFVRAGAAWPQVGATSRVLGDLLRDAPDRHVRLAEAAGVAGLIQRQGLVYAYPDPAAFALDARVWALRRDQGVQWTVLSGAAARALAPWMAARYELLVHVPSGAHCIDPGAYVSALVRQAEREGAVRVQGRAVAWQREGERVVGLRVAGQGAIRADRMVLAAGIASAELARALGDRVNLASERGYHIVLPLRPGERPPLVPVMPSDGKMAVTLTAQGLRIAGQVELADTQAAPDWRRADVLWRHAARMLNDEAWAATTVAPHRHEQTVPPGVARWMGHRPSMADGLPSIGPSRRNPEVIHAFGHGHVGLAAAPITAQWVCEWIAAGGAPHRAAQACLPARLPSGRPVQRPPAR